MLDAVNGFCNLLNVAGKTLSVVDAGSKIYATANKNGERSASEIIDMTAQGIFIVAQVGDVCSNDMGLIDKSYSKICIGFKATTGALDIARGVTSRVASDQEWSCDDTVDLVSSVLMRGGEVASFTAERHPHVLCGYAKATATGGNVIGTIGTAVRNRKVIITSGQVVINVFSNMCPGQAAPQADGSQDQPVIPQRQAAPQADGRQNQPVIPQRQAAPQADGRQNQPPEQMQANENMSEEDVKLRSVNNNFKNNPLAFDSIPSFLPSDGFPYICAITKRPVRHLLIPPLTDAQLDANSDLYKISYERDTFNDWLHKNPGQAPPGWPTVLEFVRANHPRPDRRSQQTIETHMKFLAANLIEI